MEKEIYNLCDFLNQEEIDFLKDRDRILLTNKDKITMYLKSNNSLKQQVTKIKKELDIDISVFTYRNFLLKYFKKAYEEHNINKVFLNSQYTILRLILNEGFDDSKKIYNFLLNNGSLKIVKNDENSVIKYIDFYKKLEEFISTKNLSLKIIPEDEDNLNEVDIKNEIHDSEIVEIIDNTKRIDIELIDGSTETHNISFLKNYYIVEEFSGKKFDFVEKNLYLVPNTNEGKVFDFAMIKELIKDVKLMPEYSLVLYDNSNIDAKIYIYRYINGDLVFLDSFSSLLIVDILDLINLALKKFLTLYKIYFEKENKYVKYENS
ncbi:hypothetical protein CRU96_12380 [Malaciobacter halophilus]|uniref:hypothetical protein n=1 Tax=Malaciobacter marinus TaxID=505249 RepID=UPI000C085D64|nr:MULTISPECIES: hypothetical protein [Malaciobacter]PHO11607.1 hypothetical protein CPG38_12160 [Malaciobacter marinus]RYA22575.1 hypothetical protein CRU96_12380 [Malaciobacter halophilus]